MNINSIPVIGWFLSFIGNASKAIPFWICWSWFGIGRVYFDFLPYQWQTIPFWDCVGLFISIGIAKSVVLPRFASSCTHDSGKKRK